MASEVQIATWVREHVNEFQWCEGSAGGLVTRKNGVTIQIGSSGLGLNDGLRSYRIVMPNPPKGQPKDATDQIRKELYDLLKEIQNVATRQYIARLDNRKEHDRRIRTELFDQLTGGSPY